MCGIFGIIDSGKAVDLSLLRQMSCKLRHRGPDDEGYLLTNGDLRRVVECGGADSDPGIGLASIEVFRDHESRIGLGHRRLSILDLSPAGHQPMANQDASLWITYNGEIYNYRELREELKGKGRVFRSETDTEVVLAAYEEWGAAMLQRFVGMFAFAILDLRNRKLFCARDCFGIKPFYYACSKTCFVFASEISPLLGVAWVERKVNPERFYQYLRFNYTDHGDATLLQAVSQVPAAHYMVVSLDTARIETVSGYWSLALDAKSDLSFEKAAQTFRDLFLDSVSLHMRSDVPVGVCLSGGLDSSAIIMAMREVGGAGTDLHAFTYIADNVAVSEERWADIAARAAGAIHHKVCPTQHDLVADLEHFIAAQGEPVASTSPYAQHCVFRCAAKAGIKVTLDGQGADEALGGYHEHVAARLSSLIRRFKVVDAWRVLAGNRESTSSRCRMLMNALGRLAPSSIQPLLRSLINESAVPRWLDGKWFRSRGVKLRPRTMSNGWNLFREESLQLLTESSLPRLLRWEDRNSMFVSVESRVPFLTVRLVEFLFSLPESYLVDGNGVRKAILRTAMRGLVPDELLDRKDKIGFATPERMWLSGLQAWGEGIISDGFACSFPGLVPARTRSEFARILASDGYYSGVSWRWLNAMKWAKMWNVEFPQNGEPGR